MMDASENLLDSSHGRSKSAGEASAGASGDAPGTEQARDEAAGPVHRPPEPPSNGHDVLFPVILDLFSRQQARKLRRHEQEQIEQLLEGRKTASVSPGSPHGSDAAHGGPAPADDSSWISPAVVDGPEEEQEERLWEQDMARLVGELRDARGQFPSEVRECLDPLVRILRGTSRSSSSGRGQGRVRKANLTMYLGYQLRGLGFIPGGQVPWSRRRGEPSGLRDRVMATPGTATARQAHRPEEGVAVRPLSPSPRSTCEPSTVSSRALRRAPARDEVKDACMRTFSESVTRRGRGNMA